MNNRKENEQSCIVMNKKEGTSCITTHLPFLSRPSSGRVREPVP